MVYGKLIAPKLKVLEVGGGGAFLQLLHACAKTKRLEKNLKALAKSRGK